MIRVCIGQVNFFVAVQTEIFHFLHAPPVACEISYAFHYRFSFLFFFAQTPSSTSRVWGSRFLIIHCSPTAQLPEKPKRPPHGSPSTRAHTLQHLFPPLYFSLFLVLLLLPLLPSSSYFLFFFSFFRLFFTLPLFLLIISFTFFFLFSFLRSFKVFINVYYGTALDERWLFLKFCYFFIFNTFHVQLFYL